MEVPALYSAGEMVRNILFFFAKRFKPSAYSDEERGKAGGYKPQHFSLPRYILDLLSSGSHKSQPFSGTSFKNVIIVRRLRC